VFWVDAITVSVSVNYICWCGVKQSIIQPINRAFSAKRMFQMSKYCQLQVGFAPSLPHSPPGALPLDPHGAKPPNPHLGSRSHILHFVQFYFALKKLSHGMNDFALQTVFRSVVIAKLQYASSAWWGFTTATERHRIDWLIRRSARCRFVLK